MALVAIEYRELTVDDYEQAARLESRAFYNRPSAEMIERMRQYFPPEWTVGAFVDGRLVADVRTVPQVRRMHGATMAFGAVGPVASEAAFRRQGYAARLLTLSLERMRERGQVLSGLHTPHDALYQRYGWERAEFKKRLKFRPKDIRLRFRSSGGRTAPATGDDWERLAAVFRERTQSRNGPFVRNEVWWREAVLKHWDAGNTIDSDAVVWVDADGRDAGYMVYFEHTMESQIRWQAHGVFIRDFQALTANAYLGLWEHMLTHDLADSIVTEAHPDDPFQQLCEDPFKIEVSRGSEGAMLRIVDVEKALAMRPSVSTRAAGFTARIEDRSLAWNDGTWWIEAAEGRTSAERTDAEADVEMSVNTLASLFTGYLKPETAAESGFIRVNRTEAVAEMAQVFAVTDPPFCPDYY